MPTDVRAESRRKFLRFLAQSPLLYGVGGALAATAARAQDDAFLSGALEVHGPHHQPQSSLERLGLRARHPRAALTPAITPTSRRAPTTSARWPRTAPASRSSALRPRRLVDVGTVDLSVEVFGQRLNSPIFLCPVGAQFMFHEEGEVAVARAAKTKNALQILSTVANLSVEDVAAARRRAGLAPALLAIGLAVDRAHAEARRGRGLHGRRVDSRHSAAQSRAHRPLQPRGRRKLPGRATPRCRTRLACGACSTAST